MSEPKRLHPITAVSNFIKQLKDLIVPFILFFVIGRGDRKEDFWDYIPMMIMTVIIIIVLIAGIVKWLRFSYRLEEGELRIEYGFFVKKKRYIPFERIQSLNYSEGILQRPFGLVKVKIETAGTSRIEAEAELTAITKADAEEIQRTITEAKKGIDIQENPNEVKNVLTEPEVTVYKISRRELLTMATTSGGAGVIISALLAFLSQFNEMIPYEKVFYELGNIVKSGVLVLSIIIVVCVLFVWLLSITITLLKYNDFTVKLVEKNVIITRGLLEKRQTTISLYRIQAIRISENPLRQFLGYATVYIESAGGSVLDKESLNVMILPIVKKERIPSVLKEIFTDYDFNVMFTKAPNTAKNRYLIREFLKVLPIVITLSIVFWPYGLLGVLLVVIAGGLGVSRFNAAGWSIQDQQLTLRYRGFLKHTMFMKKNRIQALELKESWFQRKKQLATIFSTVKSSGHGNTAKVYHLKKGDIQTIYEWYRPN